MAALLELHELYKIYKEGDVETVALRGANLTISQGEFVAITGRSGAGKSTLLNVIGGIAAPSAGRVILDGVDLSRLNERERAIFRRTHIGVIFQTENLIPFLTAYENVMLPLQLSGHHDAATRARQLLDEVGLADRAHHRPAMLSGGECQRVAIAVALANQPQLLLADELTGELDSMTASTVMTLLTYLNKAHALTLLVVTHNPTVAARATRQVYLRDGVLYNQGVRHG